MSLNVSDAWKTDIQKVFRLQGLLRATIRVEPPGLRAGASLSTSQSNPLSADVSTLMDGLTPSISAAVTLEQDRWIGNGSQYLLSETPVNNPQQPWWNNSVQFDVDNPVTVIITFDQPYDIPGMYFVWDTQTNSWPSAFKVRGYDNVDTLIQTYQFDSPTQNVQYFVETPMDECKKIILDIQGWSNPNWFVRALEITCGFVKVFNPTDIFSASFKSAVDPLMMELPTHSGEIEISNYGWLFDPYLSTGYSKYLVIRQLLTWEWGYKLSDGTIEWAPGLNLFTQKIQLPTNDHSLTLDVASRLDFLTDDYTKGTYTAANRSIKALVTEILNNCDLLLQYTGEVPYNIPAALDSIYSNAPILSDAPNATLQLLAGAAGYILSTDPTTGYIEFSTVGASEQISGVNRVLTRKQQIAEPDIIIDDQLYKIIIGVYSYSTSTSTDIYTGVFILDTQTVVHIDYSIASEVSLAVTGGTINASSIYVNGADVTITPTTPGATVTLTATGKSITSSVTYITAYQNSLLTRGLVVTIDNPYITNVDNISNLANLIYDYYTKQQDAVFTYLGYPEIFAGTKFDFETKQQTSTGTILENSIDFDGGWGGTMKTRLGG